MQLRVMVLPFVTAACGPSLSQIECPAGRTALDGVCVREDVADYVACVRASGAKLREEQGRSLAAEAGAAGTKAAVVAEVASKLEKQYSVSDGGELEIIRACGSMRGSPDTAVVNVAGIWDSGFEQPGGATADVVMTITVAGANLSAEYPVGDGSMKLRGSLQEGVAEGMWTEPGNSGVFRFVFSRDGRSFEGWWAHSSTPDKKVRWWGKKR